ncbi:MAG: hypothetical protein UE295_06230 [Acutalibacteraceae bacterium]|nr:hypothetical protein [Acutalibacteraceae bacterium]
MSYQDKRWYCDVGGETIMCNNCVHRKKGMVCDAFPNGIPRELMLRGEHDTPFPGDNGIRYKPKEA